MRFLIPLFLFIPLLALADEREECQITLIEDLAGTVSLISPKGEQTAATVGGPLQPGDQLQTEASSWADLRLCDGTGLRLGENSRFTYQGADNERESFVSWAFDLARGTLRAAVVGDGKSESVKLRFRTPSASLGVRGTELVIDANDTGNSETELHTLEGEVLMGPRSDFEKMGTLRGPELIRQFEPVGAEKMSVIHAGETRPLKAAAYRLWEFKAARKHVFARSLEKRSLNEIRTRFQEAHKRLKAKRAERGLFEREREKIEQKMSPPAPARAPRLNQEAARAERIQEKAARTEARRERREERLQEKVQKNQEKTENKRQRKGWEKRRNTQPGSPRQEAVQ